MHVVCVWGAFAAHCPSCRANDPNGGDASKPIKHGKIDNEALSFLQLRGVIDSTTFFRFTKAAAASAPPAAGKAKAGTSAADYEACPAGCGQYILWEHESYSSSIYATNMGEIMTIIVKATDGSSGVVHDKCFSPGCTFKCHSSPADWNGGGRFCCHACMNGNGHGGRCERVPSGDPTNEKLAVRLGQCPNCTAAVCSRCKTLVKPESRKSHMCAQVTAETDQATLELLAKIGKKCPGCGKFTEKTQGCHIMMCGTDAHGKVRDALRNGGCAYIFDWNTMQGCEDGHGYYDINDKWVRGKGPTNERQVLVNK